MKYVCTDGKSWERNTHKKPINNDDVLEKGRLLYNAKRLSSRKETDVHVHTRFVLFHHNDGGGDFGGGVDDACPIPGPEGQVVHSRSACLIGQFQIQSIDVLTTLGSQRLPGHFICPTCIATQNVFLLFLH